MYKINEFSTTERVDSNHKEGRGREPMSTMDYLHGLVNWSRVVVKVVPASWRTVTLVHRSFWQCYKYHFLFLSKASLFVFTAQSLFSGGSGGGRGRGEESFTAPGQQMATRMPCWFPSTFISFLCITNAAPYFYSHPPSSTAPHLVCPMSHAFTLLLTFFHPPLTSHLCFTLWLPFMMFVTSALSASFLSHTYSLGPLAAFLCSLVFITFVLLHSALLPILSFFIFATLVTSPWKWIDNGGYGLDQVVMTVGTVSRIQP